MIKLFTFCTVSLFALFSATQAQTFSTPIKVNSASGLSEHAPCMHMGRNGTIYVSWFANNADIYFTRSSDGGTTFRPAVHAAKQVTTNEYTSLLQRVPQFAIDTLGTIHMIWMEDRIIAGQTDVWYIRSTDEGATWTTPVSIMDKDDSSKYAQDFPAIAIDSSNNLYVAYLDFRGVVRKTDKFPQLFMTKSIDGGTTWDKPVNAINFPPGTGEGGTCDCCKLDIAAAKNGHVYIAFRSDISDRRDIWIARTENGGATWDPTILAQSGIWTIAACPTTGPHIVLDTAENLHLVWRDARDISGRNLIYYTLLRKGDTSVFPNRVISRTTNQSANWPDVAVAPNGALHSFYQINNGGSQQMRYTTSSDGGNTWTQDIPIPGPTNVDQEIASCEVDRAGNICIVWQDSRTDLSDIYFMKLLTPLAVSSPGKVSIISPKAQLPESPALIFSWTCPTNTGNGEFLWYDITVNGPTPLNLGGIRTDSISITNVRLGHYDYQVVAHSLTGSSTQSGSVDIVPLGINNLNLDRSFSVRPNPIIRSQSVTVRLSLPAHGTVSFQVADESGEIILSRSLDIEAGTHEIPFECSQLAAGIYTVLIKGAGFENSMRVIIE